MASSYGPKLEDCLCPICLEILFEPVTLPCHHELCMACFKEHLDKTSLECPMCRARISSWAREASRTKTLINKERWDMIRRHFNQEVRRRADGLNMSTSMTSLASYALNAESQDAEASHAQQPVLAEPGEIRKEYEEELKRIEEEKRLEAEREEELSNALIHRLHMEEQLRTTEGDLALAEQIQASESADPVVQSDFARMASEENRGAERRSSSPIPSPRLSPSHNKPLRPPGPNSPLVVHHDPDEIFGYEPSQKPEGGDAGKIVYAKEDVAKFEKMVNESSTAQPPEDDIEEDQSVDRFFESSEPNPNPHGSTVMSHPTATVTDSTATGLGGSGQSLDLQLDTQDFLTQSHNDGDSRETEEHEVGGPDAFVEPAKKSERSSIGSTSRSGSVDFYERKTKEPGFVCSQEVESRRLESVGDESGVEAFLDPGIGTPSAPSPVQFDLFCKESMSADFDKDSEAPAAVGETSSNSLAEDTSVRFRPISTAPVTPPKRLTDGRPAPGAGQLVRIQPIKLPEPDIPVSSENSLPPTQPPESPSPDAEDNIMEPVPDPSLELVDQEERPQQTEHPSNAHQPGPSIEILDGTESAPFQPPENKDDDDLIDEMDESQVPEQGNVEEAQEVPDNTSADEGVSSAEGKDGEENEETTSGQPSSIEETTTTENKEEEPPANVPQTCEITGLEEELPTQKITPPKSATPTSEPTEPSSNQNDTESASSSALPTPVNAIEETPKSVPRASTRRRRPKKIGDEEVAEPKRSRKKLIATPIEVTEGLAEKKAEEVTSNGQSLPTENAVSPDHTEESDQQLRTPENAPKQVKKQGRTRKPSANTHVSPSKDIPDKQFKATKRAKSRSPSKNANPKSSDNSEKTGSSTSPRKRRLTEKKAASENSEAKMAKSIGATKAKEVAIPRVDSDKAGTNTPPVSTRTRGVGPKSLDKKKTVSQQKTSTKKKVDNTQSGASSVDETSSPLLRETAKELLEEAKKSAKQEALKKKNAAKKSRTSQANNKSAAPAAMKTAEKSRRKTAAPVLQESIGLRVRKASERSEIVNKPMKPTLTTQSSQDLVDSASAIVRPALARKPINSRYTSSEVSAVKSKEPQKATESASQRKTPAKDTRPDLRKKNSSSKKVEFQPTVAVTPKEDLTSELDVSLTKSPAHKSSKGGPKRTAATTGRKPQLQKKSKPAGTSEKKVAAKLKFENSDDGRSSRTSAMPSSRGSNKASDLGSSKKSEKEIPTPVKTPAQTRSKRGAKTPASTKPAKVAKIPAQKTGTQRDFDDQPDSDQALARSLQKRFDMERRLGIDLEVEYSFRSTRTRRSGTPTTH